MKALRPALFGLLLVWSLSAMAYIDPNAGGFLFQVVFPILAAISASLVVLRQRIGLWLSRLRRRK